MTQLSSVNNHAICLITIFTHRSLCSGILPHQTVFSVYTDRVKTHQSDCRLEILDEAHTSEPMGEFTQGQGSSSHSGKINQVTLVKVSGWYPDKYIHKTRNLSKGTANWCHIDWPKIFSLKWKPFCCHRCVYQCYALYLSIPITQTNSFTQLNFYLEHKFQPLNHLIKYKKTSLKTFSPRQM